MIFRNDFVEFFFGCLRFDWSAGIGSACIRNARIRSARILAGGSQASSLRSQRQLRNKLSYLRDAVFIVLNAIVSNSRQFVMRACAAESFIIDRLTSRAFDQVRAAQAHER